VSINVTNVQDGASWQVQGMQVLFTDPIELKLSEVGLYLVDYNTGFEITVGGPVGTPDQDLTLPGFPTAPDPRGEPIAIYGIGLDKLPAVMDEPMKIINSVSITRR
jgi:hypothetical protein